MDALEFKVDGRNLGREKKKQNKKQQNNMHEPSQFRACFPTIDRVLLGRPNKPM